MSAAYILGTTSSGGFTATCRACGEAYAGHLHSWVLAWRLEHSITCPGTGKDGAA